MRTEVFLVRSREGLDVIYRHWQISNAEGAEGIEFAAESHEMRYPDEPLERIYKLVADATDREEA